MSFTHRRFGASRVNILSTRSPAVGVSCRGRGCLWPGKPLIPARAINKPDLVVAALQSEAEGHSACTRRMP